MRDTISRRDIIAGAAGLGTAQLLAAMPAAALPAIQDTPAATPVPVPERNGLTLFTTIDGVKLAGIQKFSFAWPEPAAPFGGLHFAFEIITFENAYAVDPDTVELYREQNALTFTASGFTWAGGQEKRAGKLVAHLVQRGDGAIRWHVETDFAEPVKAVKTIVRGLPRGRFSMSAKERSSP